MDFSSLQTTPSRVRYCVAGLVIGVLLAVVAATSAQTGRVLAGFVVAIMGYTLGDKIDSLERGVRVDSLTKLPNRRYFAERFGEEVARASRHGEPLSLMLIDIDHFKHINDRFGHGAGDSALAAVAKALTRTCRASDVRARYGGDEFAVLLPTSGTAEANLLAQRLKAECQRALLHELVPYLTEAAADSHSLDCSVSIGVAGLGAGANRNPEALFEAADLALYEAKRGGRNRVAVSQAPAAAVPHVLVVDDDDDIRTELASLLDEAGYRVTTAINGEDALRHMRGAKAPQVVLLDLAMPIMDGWAFRAQQLEDPKLANVPVVVLSGLRDSRHDTDSLHAAAHLTKPFGSDQLLDALSHVGDGRWKDGVSKS